MIFEKKGMYKSTHGAKKFSTHAEALEWEIEYLEEQNAEQVAVEEKFQEFPDDWTPLDRLRGHKDELDEYEDNLDNCEDCGCDPCECD